MLSSRDIKTLHPTLQRGAAEFLKRCEKAGLKVLITETIRDAEYQATLYAKGRARIGSIVTNLRGTKGQESPHQFGVAFDICKNVKGNEYNDSMFFKKCGDIWKEMGGVWGGDWTSFVDKPHFEFTNGKSVGDFRKGYKMPNTAKMKWEVNSDIEDTKKLLAQCDAKGVPYQKEHWNRVLNGEIKPVPEYVKTLVERLAAKK